MDPAASHGTDLQAREAAEEGGKPTCLMSPLVFSREWGLTYTVSGII